MKILIRDCFVTGKWGKSEDAEELLKYGDLSDDAYGDFEDLETGEKHEVEKPDSKEKLMDKKKKLKKKFDAEYDDQEEYSYYNDLKSQVDQQAQVIRIVYSNLIQLHFLKLQIMKPIIEVQVSLQMINNLLMICN